LPVYKGEGGERELLSAVIDISERKTLERNLVQSEERFRKFCEDAPDVIARFDKNFRYLYINPAVEELTGLSREHFIGKTNEELGMPVHLCAQWNNILHRVFTTGETATGEFNFPLPAEQRFFQIRAFPESSKTSTVQYATTIVRDITGLTRTQEELERKVSERTDKLVQLNRSLEAEIKKRRSSERALKNSRAEVQRKARQRQYLSRKLVETLEKDRRKAALSLHDEVGQILTTLKMDLESIRSQPETIPESAVQKLKTAEDKAIKAIQGIKNISRELRPSALDRLGLIPSIRTLVDHVKDSGIEVQLFSGDFSDRLHPDVELALFRIVQEALMNVIKHAQANRVFINFTMKDAGVLLSIEDDGVGFDYDEARDRQESFGILIMKERAAMLKGEMRIESHPGNGTHVMVEIPKR
ncbi:MAG: PAS domain S-box protein, partial [Thermodesulfobacteriota bacterium]